MAFHYDGLFHDCALLHCCYANGESQYPARLSATLRHGAHLHPRVYGFTHGIHGTYHHDIHRSQRTAAPARLHHY